MKVRIYNMILEWFGMHVFSIYILQRLPMILLDRMGLIDSHKYLCLIAVFALTIPLAIAFEKATALEKIAVPESVTKIGWSSFKSSGNHASFFASSNVSLIEDDAFGWANSSAQRIELFLEGDPVIELYHPGGPSGSKNTYALDSGTIYRVWTNQGPNFQAYKSKASYVPSDIRPFPAGLIEITSTEKELEIGEAPDKSKVTVTLEGETLSEDEFDLVYNVSDRTTGERQVGVTLKNGNAPQYFLSNQISALNFYTTAKEGPVYSVVDGNNLSYTVNVVAAEYSFVKGDGATWVKHQDTNDLEFTVKREEKDELSFERFQELIIDGKTVAPEKYEAKAGSVEITLPADYLDTLSIGTHTITLMQSDGHADASFTIETIPP